MPERSSRDVRRANDCATIGRSINSPISGSNEIFQTLCRYDGQSHFEPLDTSAASEFLNATRPATGVLIRTDFAPHIVNFHGAPRRRWVITLSGSVDIGLGDGTSMIFLPGDLFLAEDAAGQGHTAPPHDWIRA